MRAWGGSWWEYWTNSWGTTAAPIPLRTWGEAWGTSWQDTWGTALTPQLLSPGEDISVGGWLPSEGANVAATLDELVASDAEYAFTSSSASAMEVKFLTSYDPLTSSGHILRYRLKGNGSTDAVVKLKQGAAVIATWTETNVPATHTNYQHFLTGAEADSITNYADLRFSIEAA